MFHLTIFVDINNYYNNYKYYSLCELYIKLNHLSHLSKYLSIEYINKW